MEPQTLENGMRFAAYPPLVVDRNEAAAALRISVRKLDYLLARGSIKPVRIDGRAVIAWAELERFISNESSFAEVAR